MLHHDPVCHSLPDSEAEYFQPLGAISVHVTAPFSRQQPVRRRGQSPSDLRAAKNGIAAQGQACRKPEIYLVTRVHSQCEVTSDLTIEKDPPENDTQVRQNLQYYLWKDNGFSLHPSIPVEQEGLRVAEIGAATGYCRTMFQHSELLSDHLPGSGSSTSPAAYQHPRISTASTLTSRNALRKTGAPPTFRYTSSTA